MLACTFDIGGPEPPGSPISIEPAAALEVQDTWQAALSDAALNGQISVILNETQMTGFIAQRLQESEHPLLMEPQIYLRENTIQIFGTIERVMLRGNILISIKPEITDDGDIQFAISEASLGPVPAPDALLAALSAMLTEAFTGSVGTLATGIKVNSLAIADGEMAIVGELR